MRNVGVDEDLRMSPVETNQQFLLDRLQSSHHLRRILFGKIHLLKISYSLHLCALDSLVEKPETERRP